MTPATSSFPATPLSLSPPGDFLPLPRGGGGLLETSVGSVRSRRRGGKVPQGVLSACVLGDPGSNRFSRSPPALLLGGTWCWAGWTGPQTEPRQTGAGSTPGSSSWPVETVGLTEVCVPPHTSPQPCDPELQRPSCRPTYKRQGRGGAGLRRLVSAPPATMEGC